MIHGQQEELLGFVPEWGTADLVIGSRYLNSSQQPLPRQKFYQMKLRSGVTITIPYRHLKHSTKKALDNLDFKSDGIRFNRDLISHFDASGLRIKEVPRLHKNQQ